MGEGSIDKIIGAVVAAMVGMIMIVSAFLPVAASQISSITTENMPGIDSIQGGTTTVVALLSVVVIMVVIALLIGIVRYFAGGSDR